MPRQVSYISPRHSVAPKVRSVNVEIPVSTQKDSLDNSSYPLNMLNLGGLANSEPSSSSFIFPHNISYKGEPVISPLLHETDTDVFYTPDQRMVDKIAHALAKHISVIENNKKPAPHIIYHNNHAD